jgi:hypothetical protein
MRRFFAVLLLAGFFLFQQFGLQVTTTKVYSEKLPEVFDGLKIVQLSDLHGRIYGKDHTLLLRRVADLAPDLIAVTGDLADRDADVEKSLTLLSGLTEIAPTYLVTGNHEWSLENRQELLDQAEALGVTVLDHQAVSITRQGKTIYLAGITDPCGPRDLPSAAEFGQSLRAKIGDDAFLLLLGHRNDPPETWAETTADLVLSGHGHGGMIRLPFLGGLVRRPGHSQYDSGLYAAENTQLYVSRGLGGQGLRCFNRPEISLIKLLNS